MADGKETYEKGMLGIEIQIRRDRVVAFIYFRGKFGRRVIIDHDGFYYNRNDAESLNKAYCDARELCAKYLRGLEKSSRQIMDEFYDPCFTSELDENAVDEFTSTYSEEALYWAERHRESMKERKIWKDVFQTSDQAISVFSQNRR